MVNTDNIDRFGHCVVCHKHLITKRVVDGQVIDMFLPIHDHTDFLLDNGSIMKVCICKPCKESVDLSDPTVHSNIMDAVYKGWELETKILVEDEGQPLWTKEHGEKYLHDMAQLNISEHADNLDKNVLAENSKELSIAFREVKKLNLEVSNVLDNAA